MKQEAEAHAQEDKKKKEQVEIRNNADQLVFQAKKQIGDLGDKVPADMKTRIENEIKNVEEALLGTDTDRIQQAVEQLNKVVNEMASNMYSQNSTTNESAKQSNEKSSDSVEDADFEVVDDNKK
jgi:molecular chaperone DnaK